jgi:molybdopterin-guanine dinucleotide biosynthesis protein A
MPFIETKVVEFLFKQITDYSAVVPKWRDGRLEPLHAVYDCEATRRAAREAVDHQASSMTGLVDHIARVRFVTVEEISTLNPNLDTFRNLNTPRDFGY